MNHVIEMKLTKKKSAEIGRCAKPGFSTYLINYDLKFNWN